MSWINMTSPIRFSCFYGNNEWKIAPLDCAISWNFCYKMKIMNLIFFFSHLDYVFNFVTGWTIIGPYLIGFIPRFVMLLLSFISDYTTYQICILYKANFNQCLTTLASSYVMLIYSTRTFSNSIEMVRKNFLMIKIMCTF